ncbi:xanthine dehydrogenase subunit D [Salipaludibacillus sp. CF4.18]|uniref:xanthine dehydrogenase subunit D n=1 Tax=Salipaludibacillus sp. CF4.18 TaxID=3373081 RepID=UPI003EE808D5
MTFPNKLYGRVLRSGVPHARILSINTSKAKALPGVKAVITAQDVPGLNGFGIAEPNQPVFCENLVRFEADAVAAVAAETKEIAAEALELIDVEYEEFEVLDTTDKALDPGARQLHENGNILHETNYSRGDIEKGFEQSAVVVEETYETPRQMHTFLETEGGIFVPEVDGKLTVYAPTQHGYKDQMQLARILDIPATDIRVISSPIGGSFGGKDELNVQPFGSLLAIVCGRPVNMHYSREESVKAGLKRHPMKVTMKTGSDKNGRVLAHQVNIVSDTGAYATLGGPVLNFATEHAIGGYTIPNVDVKGKAVYTNNGISGEFRGFGGNQVIFALEGQLDRLAEKINLDPWELRKRNLRKIDDLGPLGQRIVPNDGPKQVWEAIQQSPLYQKELSRPDETWILRGKGMSLAMHGSGLGYGIPDPAGGIIRLNDAGKIEVAFGHEEFGQGLLGTLEIMLLDHFQCDENDIEIIIGDTDRVPSTGSSTASRSTSMVWKALQNMKQPFLTALFNKAEEQTGVNADVMQTGKGGIWRDSRSGEKLEFLISFKELADQCSEPLECSTEFNFPVTPDPVIGGHYLYSSTAVIAEVEVNMLTGMVRVTGIDHVVAAGEVMNPLGYLGQIEGGSIMALGFAMAEDAVMNASKYVTKNLDTYLIPTIYDVPETQHVDAIEELPDGDNYGPRGVGEVGSVALAPAIVSAIKQATGTWITKLPITPETILQKNNQSFPDFLEMMDNTRGREKV